MTRKDETKCMKGLHDWETNKKNRGGNDYCGACKDDYDAAIKAGERTPHPKGSDHCKRGHAYTPENTRKQVQFKNGKRYVVRSCLRCKEDANRMIRR